MNNTSKRALRGLAALVTFGLLVGCGPSRSHRGGGPGQWPGHNPHAHGGQHGPGPHAQGPHAQDPHGQGPHGGPHHGQPHHGPPPQGAPPQGVPHHGPPGAAPHGPPPPAGPTAATPATPPEAPAAPVAAAPVSDGAGSCGLSEHGKIEAQDVPGGVVLLVDARDGASQEGLDRAMANFEVELKKVKAGESSGSACPLFGIKEDGNLVMLKKDGKRYQIVVQPKLQKDLDAVVSRATKITTKS